jgi:hypothetical protein
VGFVVDKVALGQVFPCQFTRNSTGAPLLGKTKKLVIFITGLHYKPQGCGAFVASAAGPFTTKKDCPKNKTKTDSNIYKYVGLEIYALGAL